MGLLLAAGMSRRMGSPKPLLDFGGKTALEICLESLLNSGVQAIVVVTNPMLYAKLSSLAHGLPVRFVVNPNRDSEMGDSLRLGIRALNGHREGVLVSLIDQPLVKTATVRALIRAFVEDATKIVIPTHKGKKGHPVLLPSKILATLGANETLKGLISRHDYRVRVIETPDPAVLLDLDTKEAYLKAKRSLGRTEASPLEKPFEVEELDSSG